MKEHEKRKIIEEEVKRIVQEEMKNINLRVLVDQLMVQIIKQQMAYYDFPEKSIPAKSIDFNGFTLSQESCVIDKWENFESTGIKDNASTTKIEITDDSIFATELDVKKLKVGTIDLRGKIKVGDPMFTKITETIYNSAMQQFRKEFDKLDWAIENINRIDNKQQKKSKK